MKLEDLIEEIKTRLESLRGNISKLYPALPGLFRATEQLSLINNNLASEIKARLLELNSLTNESEINPKINEIELILTSLKSQIKEDTYLGVSDKFYSKDYKNAKEVYRNTKLVNKKEDEIMQSPSYMDRLHEPLKKITKKYGHCLHARLTGNLRIIYKVEREKNRILFLDIMSHDEMDKLF